jgi:hypothetical protein
MLEKNWRTGGEGVSGKPRDERLNGKIVYSLKDEL